MKLLYAWVYVAADYQDSGAVDDDDDAAADDDHAKQDSASCTYSRFST